LNKTANNKRALKHPVKDAMMHPKKKKAYLINGLSDSKVFI
jgi:hypothetical protein